MMMMMLLLHSNNEEVSHPLLDSTRVSFTDERRAPPCDTITLARNTDHTIKIFRGEDNASG